MAIDGVYFGLIRRDIQDPPLDLTSKEQKDPCGKHQEGPTPRSAPWEDLKFKMIQENTKDQEEKNGGGAIGPIVP